MSKNKQLNLKGMLISGCVLTGLAIVLFAIGAILIEFVNKGNISNTTRLIYTILYIVGGGIGLAGSVLLIVNLVMYSKALKKEQAQTASAAQTAPAASAAKPAQTAAPAAPAQATAAAQTATAAQAAPAAAQPTQPVRKVMCPMCKAVIDAGLPACPNCGVKFRQH